MPAGEATHGSRQITIWAEHSSNVTELRAIEAETPIGVDSGRLQPILGGGLALRHPNLVPGSTGQGLDGRLAGEREHPREVIGSVQRLRCLEDHAGAGDRGFPHNGLPCLLITSGRGDEEAG